MSTFDERYQMLEQALHNALARLDHYVQNEATMNDAVMKLNEELQSKMNSDAEKKLKRFFGRVLNENSNYSLLEFFSRNILNEHIGLKQGI